MKLLGSLWLICVCSTAAADVTLRPGECVLLYGTRVCAINIAPTQRTVVVVPVQTQSPKSRCLCQYGTHPTEGDEPQRGFWVLKDTHPAINFLNDEVGCERAAKTLALCF